MEFKITDDIPLIGQPLKEIKFPEGVLLVGVYVMVKCIDSPW